MGWYSRCQSLYNVERYENHGYLRTPSDLEDSFGQPVTERHVSEDRHNERVAAASPLHFTLNDRRLDLFHATHM